MGRKRERGSAEDEDGDMKKESREEEPKLMEEEGEEEPEVQETNKQKTNGNLNRRTQDLTINSQHLIQHNCHAAQRGGRSAVPHKASHGAVIQGRAPFKAA